MSLAVPLLGLETEYGIVRDEVETYERDVLSKRN